MFALPDHIGERLYPRYHGSCIFEWRSPFLGVVNETILAFVFASCCAVASGGNVRGTLVFWKWCWILLISMCEWLLSGSVCEASHLKTLYVFESPELIENVKLIHKPVSLQPRGLVNKGNWCYINAVSFSFYLFFPPSGFSWLEMCF